MDRRAATAVASSRRADSAPGIAGLPSGVPAAATAPEPVLPEPSSGEWPFPNNFSHTSGTGLLSGGASLWTDFLYDDHGPLGSPVGIAESAKVSDLAPVHGGFVYPEGPADNNGADIFRAAVGYSHGASYWRVDWNTLANADVPIAEWTFSTEGSTPGGGRNVARQRRPEIGRDPVRADRLRAARAAAGSRRAALPWAPPNCTPKSTSRRTRSWSASQPACCP